MDKDFYNDGFEQLLKERTEEFKMYPSESVWNNIFNKLHPGRRWGVIGGSLLLLLFTASVLVLRTTNHNNTIAGSETKKNTTSDNSEATINEKQQNISANDNDDVIHISTTSSLIKDNSDNYPKSKTSFTKITSNSFAENAGLNKGNERNYISNGLNKEGNSLAKVYSENERINNNGEILNTAQANIFYAGTPENNNAVYELAVNDLKKAEGTEKESVLAAFKAAANGSAGNGLPKTTSPKKYSRFEWQLYFTPSISYRALYNDYNNTNLAYAFNSFIPGDIDKAVNHTPALGFEIGNVVMFSLNNSIKIKTGLQFNYSRYNIKAYSTNPELTTLRLRGAYNQTEELKVASSYKNYGVYYHSTTISSQNSAISLPIGVDLKLAGKNKISWYVSGSFQPTYIINNKAYLISNDLRNYVRNSELYRKFTMNSGFETYLRIEKGNGVALQIGPQLRYQINSSYTKNYPISEHLIEYGVKLGITKRF